MIHQYMLDYPSGPSVITRVLMRRNQEVRKEKVIWEQSWDWGDEATGQGMQAVSKINPPLEPPERTSPADTLILTPQGLFWMSNPLELQENKFALF